MVMEGISPQSVGREFVRQYYTLLNKAPLHLHRFYSGDSSFVHGGLDKEDESLEPVRGQQEIHEKIMQLNFRDCKAKIRQVDAHATLASGVVVQVLGELSNNHQPMRRFMQTFVLAPQTPKKYYVYNDIFRYEDEVFNEDLGTSVNEVSSSTTTVENEKSFHPPNDGIATVSILDGVQKEPHLNGGGNGPMMVNELSPRVPVEVVCKDEDLELNEKEEEIIHKAQEREGTEDATPVNEPDNEVVSTPTEAILEDKPHTQEAPVITSSASSPNSTSTPVLESNEKPTYANLFKKSGGGALVASGPLSLPSAGFSKANASQVPSSSSSSSSALAMAPTSNTSNSGLKEGSPAGFQGGKPFRGGGRGGGARDGGGRGGMGNPPASRDRYHVSRESVSSNVGDDTGSVVGGGERGRGGGSRIGMNALSNYPDSHQVFVGNLPHYCQESDLKELFDKFGKVLDVRINTKGQTQSKSNLSDKNVPNFGFVVFEDEKTTNECLSQRPITLTNGHRLNVEIKKKNNRDDGKGAFGGSSGGANRGQGSGSNFDRGSQEHLGGLGRGLNANSGRGNPRGGPRGGGGRGGFSGGRGSGSGPPPQGGGGIPGSNAQQRTTYTRRS